MTHEVYRGVVNGGTVVFLEKDIPLKDGAEVLVTPVADAIGSPAAVLVAPGGLPSGSR